MHDEPKSKICERSSVTETSQFFGLNCSEISGRQLNP